MDLAAADAAGRIDQADHSQARNRLAGAGFADDAENLALVDIKGHAVNGSQGMAPGQKFDLEIAHGKNGFGHRSLGLSASRSQSPSRLIERISAANATPGKATIHHSP